MLPSLRGVRKLAIDTETTGLSYESRPVGLSYAYDQDGETLKGYLPWGHASGNSIDRDAVVRWWNDEVASNKHITTIFHNASFDLRQLALIGCKMPVRCEDTGVSAGLTNEFRPSYDLDALCESIVPEVGSKFDEKLNQWCADTFGGQATRRAQAKNYWKAPGSLVSPYAEQDALMTLRLYNPLRRDIEAQDLTKIYEIETQLIPVLVRMYLAGVKTDVARARVAQREFLDQLASSSRDILSLVGRKLNTNSSKQLGEFFESQGITVPKTAAGNFSVKGDWLDDLDHPVANLIKDSRKAKHYANTFIQSYILDNVGPDDFIHPSFWAVVSSFGGAITGRFTSSGGLNAQNIPKRDSKFAAAIRGLFIPAYEGGQWLKLDYSQVEYRFFAHYAGGTLRESYVNNPDIDYHQMVAELTGLPRSIAKNLNFGFLYGMGQRKLARSLPDPATAEEIFREYHSRIPQVRKLSAKAAGRAIKPGYVTTWGGRRARFLRSNKGEIFGAHKALNKVIQGSAADLIKVAMIEVDRHIDWKSTIMHLTVHDELDFTIPKGSEGERMAWGLKEVMETCGKGITVPIVAEGEVGNNWWDVQYHLKRAA